MKRARKIFDAVVAFVIAVVEAVHVAAFEPLVWFVVAFGPVDALRGDPRVRAMIDDLTDEFVEMGRVMGEAVQEGIERHQIPDPILRVMVRELVIAYEGVRDAYPDDVERYALLCELVDVLSDIRKRFPELDVDDPDFIDETVAESVPIATLYKRIAELEDEVERLKWAGDVLAEEKTS